MIETDAVGASTAPSQDGQGWYDDLFGQGSSALPPAPPPCPSLAPAPPEHHPDSVFGSFTDALSHAAGSVGSTLYGEIYLGENAIKTVINVGNNAIQGIVGGSAKVEKVMEASATVPQPQSLAEILPVGTPSNISVGETPPTGERPLPINKGANPRNMWKLNELAGRFWGKIIPPGKPAAPSSQPTSPSEEPAPPTSAPPNSTASPSHFSAPNWIPRDVQSRFPGGWGTGEPTNRGEGWRWTDPKKQGNGVRIDRGNLNNSQPTQQQDHVVVRSGGQVIGRDGEPISGSIAQNAEQAHIPLSEYQGWASWNHP